MKSRYSGHIALCLGAAAGAVLALSLPASAQAPAAPPAAAAAPAPAAAAPAGPPPGPVQLAPAARAAAVNWSNARLLNADNEPGNWLMGGKDVESHRYSALTQINRANVSNLHMAYAISLGGANDVAGVNGPNIMATPLVDNGILYTVSSWGRVFKINVTNPHQADLVFITDPEIEHDGNDPETRGIALYGTSIIDPLRDGRLIAVDRDSGEILWDKQMAVTTQYGGTEQFNAAPMCTENICCGPATRPATARHPRLELRGCRPDHRQGAVEDLRRSGAGRTRFGDVDRQGADCVDPWWRWSVDHRLLRPGEQAARVGHGQSGAEL